MALLCVARSASKLARFNGARRWYGSGWEDRHLAAELRRPSTWGTDGGSDEKSGTIGFAYADLHGVGVSADRRITGTHLAGAFKFGPFLVPFDCQKLQLVGNHFIYTFSGSIKYADCYLQWIDSLLLREPDLTLQDVARLSQSYLYNPELSGMDLSVLLADVRPEAKLFPILKQRFTMPHTTMLSRMGLCTPKVLQEHHFIPRFAIAYIGSGQSWAKEVFSSVKDVIPTTAYTPQIRKFTNLKAVLATFTGDVKCGSCAEVIQYEYSDQYCSQESIDTLSLLKLIKPEVCPDTAFPEIISMKQGLDLIEKHSKDIDNGIVPPSLAKWLLK